MKIVSLVERNGEKRLYHVTNVNHETLRPIMKDQIAKKARLMTDQSKVYKAIGKEFASHESVNHYVKEYARGNVTTNTVESFLRNPQTRAVWSNICNAIAMRWTFAGIIASLSASRT